MVGAQLREKTVNKRIILAGLVAGLFSQPIAFADDDWFDRHDRDHDHYWNQREYYNARRAWEREHRDEKRCSDADLRREYDRYDVDHDHRLGREEAKCWGRW
jgi:hypothetical protein